MRSFDSLEGDRTQNQVPLLLIALYAAPRRYRLAPRASTSRSAGSVQMIDTISVYLSCPNLTVWLMAARQVSSGRPGRRIEIGPARARRRIPPATHPSSY